MIRQEQRVKEIEKQLVMTGIIDAPGTILTGLGLYGKFIAKGDAIHPILNNMAVVDTMIVVGVAIIVWCGNRFFGLIKEKSRLLNEQGF